jgi:hypothetical protein
MAKFIKCDVEKIKFTARYTESYNRLINIDLCQSIEKSDYWFNDGGVKIRFPQIIFYCGDKSFFNWYYPDQASRDAQYDEIYENNC